MVAKEYVCLYHSYLDSIQPLSDEERGRLLTAILEYGSTGRVPEMTGNERFVFPTIRSQIDRDEDRYQRTCERNAQNVQQRWNRPRNSDTTVYERIRANTTEYETYQGKGKDKCKDKGKGEDDIVSGAQRRARQVKFTPPTVEEVRAYCEERQNGIDAQEFVDHYSASGWMRGKTPIKDWRACVRTWERNSRPGFTQRPVNNTLTGNPFVDLYRAEYGGQDEP